MEALDAVQALAAEQGAVLYNIHFCNAGVGLQWWEERRAGGPCEREACMPGENVAEWLARSREISQTRLRNGLVTYSYAPTLEEAIASERKRLKGEEEWGSA